MGTIGVCENCENGDHDNCWDPPGALAPPFDCICKHEICRRRNQEARTTDKGYTFEDIFKDLDELDSIPEGKIFAKLMEKYGTCECDAELYAMIDTVRYEKEQKIIKSREQENDERLERIEEKLNYLISLTYDG